MRAPHILTLGDLVLDVVVTGDVASAREAGGAVQIFPGGSAANFAVGAARAHAAVRFVGRAGDDVAGRLLVGELEREGVTACVRIVAGLTTGHVLVMREPDGATRMIAEPGASRTLCPQDLDSAWLDVDALHVTGYSLLRAEPAPAALDAIRRVRAASPRARVTFDPAPAHLVRAYGPGRLLQELDALRFDALFPNLEEGEAMTGQTEPAAILDVLARVSSLVVLKLGADGCMVAWDGLRVHVAAVVGPVVDTTGAGDAFAAAFVVAYLRSGDAVAAARAGVAAATAVIGRLGAR